jgi:hypothetical protein
LRVVGDDLPGAVVVRAEADGPPVEGREFSAIGSPEQGSPFRQRDGVATG